MRTALDKMRGGIDLSAGSDITTDGRRILSATIRLVPDPNTRPTMRG